MAKMFTIKVPDRGDLEMNVLTLIWAALGHVDSAARERIIAYIHDRAETAFIDHASGMSPDA